MIKAQLKQSYDSAKLEPQKVTFLVTHAVASPTLNVGAHQTIKQISLKLKAIGL